MARIRQFAKDMGLSYNKAKNLVNKGRKLKDGGSSVLESTMNKITPVKAKNGKFKNPGKAMTGQFKNIQNKLWGQTVICLPITPFQRELENLEKHSPEVAKMLSKRMEYIRETFS